MWQSFERELVLSFLNNKLFYKSRCPFVPRRLTLTSLHYCWQEISGHDVQLWTSDWREVTGGETGASKAGQVSTSTWLLVQNQVLSKFINKAQVFNPSICQASPNPKYHSTQADRQIWNGTLLKMPNNTSVKTRWISNFSFTLEKMPKAWSSGYKSWRHDVCES